MVSSVLAAIGNRDTWQMKGNSKNRSTCAVAVVKVEVSADPKGVTEVVALPQPKKDHRLLRKGKIKL